MSHDSTPFYSRKLYKELTLPKPTPENLRENPVLAKYLDKEYIKIAEHRIKKHTAASRREQV